MIDAALQTVTAVIVRNTTRAVHGHLLLTGPYLKPAVDDRALDIAIDRIDRKRLKEEDARQRGSGGRGTRHLKISSAREDHAALHNVISDNSP